MKKELAKIPGVGLEARKSGIFFLTSNSRLALETLNAAKKKLVMGIRGHLSEGTQYHRTAWCVQEGA
jgi:1-acyl-sn-glycerol-3-phosphate acyltransferase